MVVENVSFHRFKVRKCKQTDIT